ncbi:MAG: glutamate--tRNA ligase, partial [Rhodoferax sp.]|nr:glutamate--tRNA ligase [Rhodoferax sp.]
MSTAQPTESAVVAAPSPSAAAAAVAGSSARRVRTRIAPSPTGFLHLGTARTALFSWAFARHFGGDFILRIEDTDVARSTQEAVDQIIAAMRWLELGYDEGPFYQMQRLDRYRAVITGMLTAGTAYHCYCQPDELEVMREAQRARGDKPRYDGRWRPEPGKVLPPVPAGVSPVVRFRNPADGEVTWNDLVKGPITIANRELDDLIIARPDGTPTYNFCVVVDDWDMQISHVIRGDDHVNNTPRQINILRALGAELPLYGHVPMILGPDGEKLSKRHGAVSVMQYQEAGYLPEAMINYLARLGWSHGDDELFDREKLVHWFDGQHLAKSPAQWDAAKLNWVNAQYLRALDDAALARLVMQQLQRHHALESADDRLPRICALFKDRCDTTVALAQWAVGFYTPVVPAPAELEKHVTAAVVPAVQL